MRVTLSIFVFTSFLISVSATESVKVDVTNQSVTVNGITPGSNGGILIDHLVPVDEHVPDRLPDGRGFYYIAQFMEAPPFSGGSYLVVLRNENQSYLLRTGPIGNSLKSSTPPNTDTEVQIPQSLAKVIYETWVNALLQVRYSPGGDPVCLDGTQYVFSTYIRGGWMHGLTWSPRPDSPPPWMVDAGDKLLAFARDPKRDAQKTEAELTVLRDKLLRYINQVARVEKRTQRSSNHSLQPTAGRSDN